MASGGERELRCAHQGRRAPRCAPAHAGQCVPLLCARQRTLHTNTLCHLLAPYMLHLDRTTTSRLLDEVVCRDITEFNQLTKCLQRRRLPGQRAGAGARAAARTRGTRHAPRRRPVGHPARVRRLCTAHGGGGTWRGGGAGDGRDAAGGDAGGSSLVVSDSWEVRPACTVRNSQGVAIPAQLFFRTLVAYIDMRCRLPCTCASLGVMPGWRLPLMHGTCTAVSSYLLHATDLASCTCARPSLVCTSLRPEP